MPLYRDGTTATAKPIKCKTGYRWRPTFITKPLFSIKIKYLKKYIIISTLVIVGFVFVKFGRSLYMPILNKLKGKETIETLLPKIQNKVWDRLEMSLGIAGFKMDFPKEIILVAFKEERVLEVYTKDYTGIKLLKEYPFTAYSGKLGPKLKDGDRQIPEGIYKVDYLNPNSSYYLSIKLNYPNEFDKSKTKFSSIDEMGKDIFIHGKAATRGCIPIGDEAIEEVFVLAQKAINNEVKVIISPRDFRKNNSFPEIKNINREYELYLIKKEELN